MRYSLLVMTVAWYGYTSLLLVNAHASASDAIATKCFDETSRWLLVALSMSRTIMATTAIIAVDLGANWLVGAAYDSSFAMALIYMISRFGVGL